MFLRLVSENSFPIQQKQKIYRISGSTNPGNLLYLNNKEIKLYSNGTFTSPIPLLEGENLIIVEAISSEGEKLKKEMKIFREKEFTPGTEIPEIQENEYLPSASVIAQKGEFITLEFKGTRGCKGSGPNDIKMKEIVRSESDLIGTYRGIYRLSDSDIKELEFTLQCNEKIIIRRTGIFLGTVPDPGFWVGYTGQDFTSLYEGLGQDRLGGARAGYLGKNIKMKSTGKFGNFYRIDLAGSKEVWVRDDEFTIDEQETPPFSYTKSILVTSTDRYIQMSMELSENLPYLLSREDKKIILEIFDTNINTNWIQGKIPELKNIEIVSDRKGQAKIIIETLYSPVWGHGAFYKNNRLILKIKKPLTGKSFNELRIAIDPGHGGENTGVEGAIGIFEKDIALSMAFLLKQELEKEGAKIFLSRNSDETISGKQRLKEILEKDIDILISLHLNSVGNYSDGERVKGVGLFYKHSAFRRLSEILFTRLKETGISGYALVGNFNFILNAPSEIPNALIEMGFITHPEDESLFLDSAFKLKYIAKIKQAILEYIQDGKTNE